MGCASPHSRITLVFVLVALLLACRGSDGMRPSDTRPSFLFILVDALRQDHVGVYGYEKPTTPFIDELARSGIVFERAFAQAPQTLLSTMTMFAGLYFPHMVVSGEGKERGLVPYTLHAENVTLAERFRQAGYQTVGIFTNPHHHPSSGFHQGFEHKTYLPQRDVSLPYGLGSVVNSKFFEWHARERRRSAPLFAYVHYMDVHNPYAAPREFREQFVKTQGVDRYVNGIPDPEDRPSAADLTYMIENYDAGVRYADSMIEEIVRFLRERASGKRPLVVVVASDHGDSFMENGHLGHGTSMAVEQLLVPLVISGVPDLEGERVTEVVRNIDIGATLLDIAEIAPTGRMDGQSLLGLASDAPAEAEETTNSSYAWHFHLRNLVMGDWYATWDRSTGVHRLFDLAGDEARPRDFSRDHPGVMEKIKERFRRKEALLARAKRASPSASTEAGAPIDPAIARQLRALGYGE